MAEDGRTYGQSSLGLQQVGSEKRPHREVPDDCQPPRRSVILLARPVAASNLLHRMSMAHMPQPDLVQHDRTATRLRVVHPIFTRMPGPSNPNIDDTGIISRSHKPISHIARHTINLNPAISCLRGPSIFQDLPRTGTPH